MSDEGGPMTAREKFELTVMYLLKRDIYPGPNAILKKLYGKDTTRHMLNGRQCKWREEILLEWGWTRHPFCKQIEDYAEGGPMPERPWPLRRWLRPGETVDDRS